MRRVVRTDREPLPYSNKPGSRNPRLREPPVERHITRKAALARTRALDQASLTSFRFSGRPCRLGGVLGRRPWRVLGGGGRRRVGALDLGSLVQLDQQLALRLLLHVAHDLIANLVERRENLGPLFVELDDVPAELRFHRVGKLARLHFADGLAEFRDHPILGEPAEIAAFRARVLGELRRHLGEVLAALDALFRGLRLVLGRHENMVGVVFGVGLLGLGGGRRRFP